MKNPCPSNATLLFGIDPQNEDLDLFSHACAHCGEVTPADDLCAVPTTVIVHGKSTKTELWVCHECYDEVCEEVGFNPQGDI